MCYKKTFEIGVIVNWDSSEVVASVTIDEDNYTYDNIISSAFEIVKEFEDFEHISEDDCNYDIRITDSYLEDIGITSSDELEDFGDVFYSDDNSYEYDVFEAAYACDIPFENIDEYYNGRWNSDEEFAQDMCDQLGEIPKDLPSYIHIDWEMTAKEIMYDYVESNGHYFRQ